MSQQPPHLSLYFNFFCPGIDLKVASKLFGQKFACGASITGDDEIVIQGDFKDDLFDLIPEKWPEVDEDFIEDLGEKKRTWVIPKKNARIVCPQFAVYLYKCPCNFKNDRTQARKKS